MRNILTFALALFMSLQPWSPNLPSASLPSSSSTGKSVQAVTSMPSAANVSISAATNTPTPAATATPTVTPAQLSNPVAANDVAAAASFRFISWGDAQDDNASLAVTANQVKSLSPAFTIFNGDLENDGVAADRMNAMTGAFGTLLNNTFLVRGNHDDHVSGSASLWENYFASVNRPLPSGVTNYISLDSNSTYLSYSFDYGNSRFIGLDVPGDVDLLTSAQLTFLDNRLANAENLGLTHAFIYWHGPEYCVESVHCGCTAKADGSCTPSALITVFNKHPIVSATFHGHEHILGWVHMDNSRVTGITHPYEEFISSSSTVYNSYNEYMYPARMDYYYPDVGDGSGFAAIDVNDSSFTFNIYKVGTTAPVWSRTFSKSGTITTATPTSALTSMPTATRTATRTAAPTTIRTATRTSVPTARRTPGPGNVYIFLPMVIKNVPLPAATQQPTATRTKTSAPAATSTPRRTSTSGAAPTKTNTPKAATATTSTPVAGARQLKYYLVIGSSTPVILLNWQAGG